jgi:integrase
MRKAKQVLVGKTGRRSAASLLIQTGESLAYVRDQLGHSLIKITVDMDGHLVPWASMAAAHRLDELTGCNRGPTRRKRPGLLHYERRAKWLKNR